MAKKKIKNSLQKLIGFETFTKYGVKTDKYEFVIYHVEPTNISVLPPEIIENKIHDLSLVLSAVPELEITALDGCECFDDNKANVRKRLETENNESVRKLLAADLEFLDEIQIGTSTAREFLFVYRFRKEKEEQVFSLLFNILSYMSNQLLGKGNTVAAIDELYLFLTNMTAIEYIRNGMKRVRKKDSSFILASQNIEDFLIPEIKEFTKPLFSIPTHSFFFNVGNISPTEFMDTVQLLKPEYDLISHPERGTCIFRCGNERYLLQVHAPAYKEVLFGKAGGR